LVKGQKAENDKLSQDYPIHGVFLAEILWLKLILSRAIVKKYDELRVFVGYFSDTRSIPMIALNGLSEVFLLNFIIRYYRRSPE
jgi:hypothetical protein